MVDRTVTTTGATDFVSDARLPVRLFVQTPLSGVVGCVAGVFAGIYFFAAIVLAPLVVLFLGTWTDAGDFVAAVHKSRILDLAILATFISVGGIGLAGAVGGTIGTFFDNVALGEKTGGRMGVLTTIINSFFLAAAFVMSVVREEPAPTLFYAIALVVMLALTAVFLCLSARAGWTAGCYAAACGQSIWKRRYPSFRYLLEGTYIWQKK